MSINLLEI